MRCCMQQDALINARLAQNVCVHQQELNAHVHVLLLQTDDLHILVVKKSQLYIHMCAYMWKEMPLDILSHVQYFLHAPVSHQAFMYVFIAHIQIRTCIPTPILTYAHTSIHPDSFTIMCGHYSHQWVMDVICCI